MRAVNLIPGDQRGGGSVGAGRSGGAAYAVLALLAGFAVLAIAYGKATRTVSSDQSKAAALTVRAQQDKAAAEALAPYTSFVSLRHQREEAVTELVDTRFDWAHAFHELGRVLSNQTSIAALSGQVGATPGAAATSAAPPAASPSSSSSAAPAAASASTASAVSSATPAGSVPTFTLSGCATSQTAVAQTLQRLRQMDGVREVTLQSSTKASSGSAGTSGGACPASAPVFSMTITYEPLPSATEAASAAGAKTVVATTSSTTVSTPSPEGSAR
jgi:hypothetical protein